MKVRTNRALIASRQRIGRWTAFSGLFILLAGLLASFRAQQTPAMIGVSYVALIVGMFLSSIGIYLADKWVQEPRADQVLEDALKGFDDRYCLYNYFLPAEHVLVSPYGVTVFTVKRHGDTVRYVNGKWRHEQGLFKRVQSLSRERLGDPVRQMTDEVQRMKELLGQEFPEADIPVNGVIVFTHPSVTLHTDGVSADVVHIKKLKSFVRRADKRESRIRDELVWDLQETLDRFGD